MTDDFKIFIDDIEVKEMFETHLDIGVGDETVIGRWTWNECCKSFTGQLTPISANRLRALAGLKKYRIPRKLKKKRRRK